MASGTRGSAWLAQWQAGRQVTGPHGGGGPLGSQSVSRSRRRRGGRKAFGLNLPNRLRRMDMLLAAGKGAKG